MAAVPKTISVVEQHAAPERYIRINITKQATGYKHETTVSLRWNGDGVDWRAEIDALNEEADRLARQEIDNREEIDLVRDGAA